MDAINPLCVYAVDALLFAYLNEKKIYGIFLQIRMVTSVQISYNMGYV